MRTVPFRFKIDFLCKFQLNRAILSFHSSSFGTSFKMNGLPYELKTIWRKKVGEKKVRLFRQFKFFSALTFLLLPCEHTRPKGTHVYASIFTFFFCETTNQNICICLKEGPLCQLIGWYIAQAIKRPIWLPNYSRLLCHTMGTLSTPQLNST